MRHTNSQTKAQLDQHRKFEQVLQNHPSEQDARTDFIAADVQVGPAFCVDCRLLKYDTMAIIAYGHESGAVRVSGLVSVDQLAENVARAPSWKVAYRHIAPKGQTRVIAVAFSPNGEHLASCGWDGTLIVFNIHAGVAMRTDRLVSIEMPDFPMINHESCTTMVCWEPESKHVMVGVSRVRKFQGQTHQLKIPGGFVVLPIPSDHRDLEPRELDDASELMLELPASSWSGTWESDREFIPAVWGLAALSAVHPWVAQCLDDLRILAPERPALREGRVSRRSISATPSTNTVGAGLLLAIACGDATVQLWEYQGGACKKLGSLIGHRAMSNNGGVWDVCFFAPGTRMPSYNDVEHLWLASSGEDHQVIVWDVNSMLIQSIFSQTSLGFGIVRLCCFEDVKIRWMPEEMGHTNSYQEMADDPSAITRKPMILTASWDNSLHLWDVESGSYESEHANMHAEAIFDLTVFQTEEDQCSVTRCITVARDRTMKLWNYERGSVEYKGCLHSGKLMGISFLNCHLGSNRAVFATVSHDGWMRAVDVVSRETVDEVASQSGPIWSITTPCEAYTGAVAFGDNAGDVRVYVPTTAGGKFTFGQPCCVFRHPEPKDTTGLHEVYGVSWISDVGEDVEAGIAALAIQRRPELHRPWPGPEGTMLVSICSCGLVCFWRPGHNALVHQVSMPPQRCVSTRNLDKLGGNNCARMLTGAGGGNCAISLWEVPAMDGKTFERRRPQVTGHLRGHKATVSAVCMASDGIYAASGSWDFDVIVWHMPSRSAQRTLKSHFGNISCVLMMPMSADNVDILSTSEDGALLRWDVGHTSVKRMYLGHDAPVRSCCVCPTGRWMVSGDDAGVMLIRRADTSSSSINTVWKGFIKWVQKARLNIPDAETHEKLFKTFVRPPSTILQSMIFPYRTTYLHYFAMIGDLDAIRWCFETLESTLRDSKAKAGILPWGMKRDCFNKTPIDWAIAFNHVHCVDEFLHQASKYSWVMGEVLSDSLASLGALNVHSHYQLHNFARFLDSRFMPLIPLNGEHPALPSSSSLRKLCVGGFDRHSLTLAELSRFYGIPSADLQSGVASSGSTKLRLLYLPNFFTHITKLKQEYDISAGDMLEPNMVSQCVAWVSLTQFMWTHQFKRRHWTTFVFYVLFVVLGELYLFLWTGGEEGAVLALSFLHAAFLAIASALRNLGEMQQLRVKGFKKHFSSSWNWLQFFGYPLVTIFAIGDCIQRAGLLPWLRDTTPIMENLITLFFFFNMLSYLRGSLKLAIVVRMVGSVLKSLTYFLVVYVIAMSAFMSGLWMLVDTSEALVEEGGDEDRISSATDMVTTLLRVGLLLEYRKDALAASIEPRYHWVMELEYWTVTFLLAIVLLNLLIAVTNDEYSNLVMRQASEASRERYTIMNDLDMWAGNLKSILGEAPRLPRYLVVYAKNSSPKGVAHRADKSGIDGGVRRDQGAGRLDDLDMRISTLVVSHFAELEERVFRSTSVAPESHTQVPFALPDSATSMGPMWTDGMVAAGMNTAYMSYVEEAVPSFVEELVFAGKLKVPQPLPGAAAAM